MKEYFKLTDSDKKELMDITSRLRESAQKNLTPQRLPEELTEEDVAFVEEMRLPHEFFNFFTIDRNEKEAA